MQKTHGCLYCSTRERPLCVGGSRRLSSVTTSPRHRPSLNTVTEMRKLKIVEHISLDGVIQHSADDDGFPYSDWTAPYRTPAGRDAMLAAYGASFDLLLGRRTYDIWSGFWPKIGRASCRE